MAVSSSNLLLKLENWHIHLKSVAKESTPGYQTIRKIQQLRKNSGRPDVFVGAIGPTGEAPTAKIIFKFGGGPEVIDMLHHEFLCYSKYLRHLQGTVIPRCYGLYTGAHANGCVYGCLILELCRETPLGLFQDTEPDNDEFIRRFMLGVCQIHQAGVIHNFLNSDSHIIRQGRQPRIIDFSNWTSHLCAGASPATADSAHRINECVRRKACPELVLLEETIGVTRGGGLKSWELIPFIVHKFKSRLHTTVSSFCAGRF